MTASRARRPGRLSRLLCFSRPREPHDDGERHQRALKRLGSAARAPAGPVGAPSGGAPQLSRDSQDGLLEYFGKQQLGREASCSPILQAAHAAAVKRGLDGLGDGTRSAALPTPPTTPAAARRQLDGAASSSAGAGAFKQESYSAALAAEQQGGSWRATQGAALDPECKGRDGGSGGQRSRREGGSPTAVLHCRDDSGLPSGSESGLRSGSVALGSAGCVSAVSSVAQSPRPPAAASFGNSTSGRLSLSAPPISTGGDLVIYSSGGSSMGASRSASRRASSLQLSVRSASGEGAPSRRHTALVVMPCSDSEEEELEAPPRRRATSLHRRLSGVYEGHHVQLRKLKRQMGDTAEAPADLLALMARRVFTSQSALATVNSEGLVSNIDPWSSMPTQSPRMPDLNSPSLPRIRTRVTDPGSCSSR